MEKCINDWVLIVDADERIPEDTADAIAGIISKPPGAEAFSFKRRNYLHGRWIRRCGWWPDRVVRLVRKKRGCFHSLTHERWITNGTTTDLDASIDHYSFSGYEEMLQVMETRSTHMARELFDSGKKVTALSPFIHGFAMFLVDEIVDQFTARILDLGYSCRHFPELQAFHRVAPVHRSPGRRAYYATRNMLWFAAAMFRPAQAAAFSAIMVAEGVAYRLSRGRTAELASFLAGARDGSRRFARGGARKPLAAATVQKLEPYFVKWYPGSWRVLKLLAE